MLCFKANHKFISERNLKTTERMNISNTKDN